MAQLITLRGGLIVRASAIALGCDLEARGYTLTARDGVLFVSPRTGLTRALVDDIRDHKAHLLALAAYEAPPV